MQQEVSRYLFLAGGLIFVVLGVVHAALTPRHAGHTAPLSPSDAHVATAMSQTPLRLTRRTNMWLAWVGFNYSHGLGLVVLGGVVLLIGRSQSSFAADANVFAPFAFFASAVYLLLAIQFWFRTPIIACALCCLFFLGSWLLNE